MNKRVGCWFPLKVECRLSLRLENTEKKIDLHRCVKIIEEKGRKSENE